METEQEALFKVISSLYQWLEDEHMDCGIDALKDHKKEHPIIKHILNKVVIKP